jgi:signal transduction histidine kinase
VGANFTQMKKHTNPKPESTILRRKAEDLLKMKKAEKNTRLAESDAIKLLHELQVYQIELEMQNEELDLAKKQAADLAAEKFNELYDLAPSGYFTLSRDGKIVKLNFNGADMLGKERSRLINNLFSFYISDDTKPDFNLFLEKIFTSDLKQSCEVTLLVKGKDPVYVQLSGICSVSQDECLVIATDISGRIRTEELLKQNEAVLAHHNELFSHLLKNLQIGVFMVEAPSGKPLLANEKALELLGRGILPDANRHNLAEVYKAFKAGSRLPYPPEEMPILMGMYGKAAQVDDMIVMRPDGTEIPLEISGTPVKDKDGKVWASLVSFMDISERKKAEAEIKAKNEELLKINAEKDKFFSIIAHDLRSPFNAFLGLTRMMEEELPSLTSEEIQTYAVSMRKSATMLFHLLENLLEWSRMQRGLISFKPQTFVLSSEIATAIELVRDAADKKMISISLDIPENILVKADARMFESLMRNLIFNAIKFTPKSGKITIAARKIAGNLTEIAVSDTGIGMDSAMIKKLFLLNEQAYRKGTEGEPSTGLGLVICKDFAEKHGGKIWVESETGKGSTFYLTIAGANDKDDNSIINTKVPKTEESIQIKKLQVLIVEDDEISKMLLTTSMKNYSKEILFARTGTETVAIARNNPDIDLIMMDIQIPDMDGYEATRQIRQFNKEVVIIAQTAYGLTSDCEKAIEAGCNDYISKPLNITSLKALIQKYFN